MKRETLSQMCTALLILLFAYTAVSKFLEHDKFVFQMGLSPLPLMRSLAPYLAWIMPSLESVIIIGLFSKEFRLRALYASVILLLVFSGYIFMMLVSGQQLPCTCGGIISKMSWKGHLVFNAGFILIACIPICQLKKQKGVRNMSVSPYQDLSRA